jgi:hypothetical protein
VGPTIIEGIIRNAPPQVGGISRTELEAMLPALMQELSADGTAISDQAPAYTGMLCDPDGRLWLAQFSLEDSWTGRGRTWEIFDGRSMPLASARLPAGFHPLRFGGELLIGVLEDSLGVHSVAAVSVAEMLGGP